ncbi:hypothetical protein ACHAWF_007898 [Thalassiosira exigua]
MLAAPPSLLLLFAAAASAAAAAAAAFAPSLPRPGPSRTSSALLGRRHARPLAPLRARLPEDDMADDFPSDDSSSSSSDETDGLDALYGKKLGINVGSYLPSLSPDEIADIKLAAQKTLDDAVDKRLAEIDDLRRELQDDLTRSRERMARAAELNVRYEEQNLMEKIDRLSDEFLNKDKDFRESTKRAADADARKGREGGGRMEQERAYEADEATSVPKRENRVLVAFDGAKDKGAAPIVERLASLLDEAFDSDVIVDTCSPSGNVPLGGNDAQTAVVFATSLNDRSSLEGLLGRILKRTAPVAGGPPGSPPGHVVLVGRVGTERTNRMPYSMQNLLGGKLDKLREMEEAIVGISRGRVAGRQAPLDYTVVKFGDVAPAAGGGGGGGGGGDEGATTISVRPGDVLDGTIDPDAAARVLLQAAAYQPHARNATLCAAGSLPPGTADLDAATWGDEFLRLAGPELLRIDAGPGEGGVGSADAAEDGVTGTEAFDSKFEQLRQYVKQWSAAYEGDRKGTGLTTPVLVRKSRRPASAADGVVSRAGVRILFQATNTGDRYKSASEERLEERERNGPGAVKKSTPGAAPAVAKARKEGGVEVLVEKTAEGNVRVRARRCNVDEKTIVKEMSEEVIVRSLKKAVEAWVKARAVTGF